MNKGVTLLPEMPPTLKNVYRNKDTKNNYEQMSWVIEVDCRSPTKNVRVFLKRSYYYRPP